MTGAVQTPPTQLLEEDFENPEPVNLQDYELEIDPETLENIDQSLQETAETEALEMDFIGDLENFQKHFTTIQI